MQLPQRENTHLPPAPKAPQVKIEKESRVLRPVPFRKPVKLKTMIRPVPVEPSFSDVEKLARQTPPQPSVFKPVNIKVPTNAIPTKASSHTRSISKNKGAGNPNIGLLDKYISEVREKIKKHKFYPESAREEGLEGKVLVSFEIKKNGFLKKINVAKSSGYDLLDRAAIYTIKSASPFPPIPNQIGKDLTTLKIWIKFKLD